MSIKMDINNLIEMVNSQNGVILRKYNSRDNLADLMQEIIDGGQMVMFYPEKKYMKYFFNTKGFVSEMEGVLAMLKSFDLVYGPGLCGRNHAVIIKPCEDRIIISSRSDPTERS